MLMVLVLHTILNFTLRSDFFPSKAWFLFEPIVALSKTSVLLFFILSGYLVLTKVRSIEQHWQKTRDRLLRPLLFFSAVNIGYNFLRYQQGPHDSPFWQQEVIRMTNFPSSVLWFLGVLCIFYVLNPLFQLIFAEKEPALARYLTLLAFGFSIAAQIIMFPAEKVGMFFTSFTGWLGYLALYFYGGLVRKNWSPWVTPRIAGYLAVFGFVLTVLGDYYTMSTQVHNIRAIWAGYTNYLSVPVLMMTLGLFHLLRERQPIEISSPHLRTAIVRFVESVAPLSFGVYLIHSFVISLLTDVVGFDFNKVHMNVYLYNVVNFGLVFGSSALITWLLRRSPTLRGILGE